MNQPVGTLERDKATLVDAATGFAVPKNSDAALKFDRFTFPEYDNITPALLPNFCDLLQYQGEAHGREINRSAAEVVAQKIGEPNGFEVIFLAGHRVADPANQQSVIGMMTVTTKVLTGWGPVLRAEDAVVYPEFRGHGLGRHIFDKAILHAWENGLYGMIWETARANQSAQRLFQKIDPEFNLNKLSDVWFLTAAKCKSIACNPITNSPAVLARNSHMNELSECLRLTLNGSRNLGAITALVAKQNQRNPERNEPFVMVVPNTGSFFIASPGFSTFDGKKRLDSVQCFMHPQASAHDWDADQTRLIQAMSSAVVQLNMGGGVHIEQLHSFGSDNKSFEQNALSELRQAGAEVLMHMDSPMVGYALVGRRYHAAAINAYNNLAAEGHGNLLSAARREQLAVVASGANMHLAAA